MFADFLYGLKKVSGTFFAVAVATSIECARKKGS
jgi:hypothetical protein